VLQKYRVRYVVVGDLERQTYPQANNAASLTLLQPVFPGQTAVYQVLPAR